jgi:hypothetical protein
MTSNIQFESSNVFFSSTNVSEFSFRNKWNDDEVENMDCNDEEKGPTLEIYGTDLTLLARQGQLGECIGKEKEVLEMIHSTVCDEGCLSSRYCSRRGSMVSLSEIHRPKYFGFSSSNWSEQLFDMWFWKRSSVHLLRLRKSIHIRREPSAFATIRT